MKRVPGKYTRGEEIANAVTHVVGSHLGAAMLALLVWQGVASGVDVGWKVTSASIFGFSMILLYAVSSAYHTVTHPPAKRVLHVMDHMAIYFLIAGSYTPFCLVTLRPEHPALGWTIFGIEWGATLAGIFFKLKTTGKFRYLSTSAYVIMGWAALAAIVPLVRTLHGLGTMWLTLGGGLYTLGCVFYLWKSLPYAHMVWHLFVLAGTISHFFCVLWYVM
ncbi:MAG: hemolysin III family protein [Kiritimatiellae bacterium]|jgi:hemolysin III|nr:hemolysin III family protein [Kiritimatiellia bacterium]